MRRRVKRVILSHNDYIHYSIATNIVLGIMVIFLGSNALDSGGMLWYFAWIASIYYWIGITMPALWRLTRRRIKKRIDSHEHRQKKTS
ncbi:MAG: hypothetical protein AAB423_03805 [Patescibacteria group bacterium]